jgi:hypothetical protein
VDPDWFNTDPDPDFLLYLDPDPVLGEIVWEIKKIGERLVLFAELPSGVIYYNSALNLEENSEGYVLKGVQPPVDSVNRYWLEFGKLEPPVLVKDEVIGKYCIRQIVYEPESESRIQHSCNIWGSSHHHHCHHHHHRHQKDLQQHGRVHQRCCVGDARRLPSAGQSVRETPYTALGQLGCGLEIVRSAGGGRGCG